MSAKRAITFASVALLYCACLADGPGLAPCFPGEGLEASASRLAVGFDDGRVELLSLTPEPALEEVALPVPVWLAGVANATGDGVIAVTGEAGAADLLEVQLVPAPSVRVLASGQALPRWSTAQPWGDGLTFLTSSFVSPGTMRLQRRDLTTGSVVGEADFPEGGAGRTPVMSSDGTRIFMTAPWAANQQSGQLCSLDAQTLSGWDCTPSQWAVSVRPAPDGRSLYSPQNWQGLVALDARTFEPLGFADSFSNPTATAFSSDSRHLFVTHQTGDHSTLAVYDTSTDQRCNWVRTGSTPVKLAMLSGGRFAVTGDYGRSLTVVDTQTMQVMARLPTRAPPSALVPLLPPPRVGPAAPGEPTFRLLQGPPEVAAELVAADTSLDPSSPRAFIGDRELTPRIQVDGSTLRLSLGDCERYPGRNLVTLSARDRQGRVAKLLVQFEEQGHEDPSRVPGQVVVTFEAGVSALDPEVRRCAHRIGALLSPESPGPSSLSVYRVPTCYSVRSAAEHLQQCPGVSSALANFYLFDR